jgi:hypothetical protein
MERNTNPKTVEPKTVKPKTDEAPVEKKEVKFIEVVALKSFSGIVDGHSYTVSKGRTINMPESADWIRCGYVKPLKKEKETATKPPAETA